MRHLTSIPGKAVILPPGHPNRKPHILLEGVEYKHCSQCDSWLKLNEFYSHGSQWDKLTKVCKTCSISTGLARHKQVLSIQESSQCITVSTNKWEFKLPLGSIILNQYGKLHFKPHALLPDGTEVKHCYKCDTLKPLNEFYPLISKADGLRDMCISCHHLNNLPRVRKGKCYYVWRRTVLDRDGHSVTAPLEAHHIFAYARFKELQTDVRNGVALSHNTHKYVTSKGSSHFTKYFCDLLQEKFGYDYSDFPLHDPLQLSLGDVYV